MLSPAVHSKLPVRYTFYNRVWTLNFVPASCIPLATSSHHSKSLLQLRPSCVGRLTTYISHEQHSPPGTSHILSHSIVALYLFSWFTKQRTLVPTYTTLKTSIHKPYKVAMLFANAIVNGTTVVLAAFMRTGVLASHASAVNCKLHLCI